MSKIPSKAKKTYSGVIFDIYQRPQKMFDGTIKTFEMAKKIYTVETIPVLKNGKIMFTKQTQPNIEDKNFYYICFPGGRLDKGETPKQGAEREMEEETGLKSDDVFLYKIYEPYHKIDYKFHLHIAKNCEFTGIQNLDGGEKVDMFEVSFDEMIDIICSETYGNYWFANDIFRMKEQGKIGEFKKILGL